MFSTKISHNSPPELTWRKPTVSKILYFSRYSVQIESIITFHTLHHFIPPLEDHHGFNQLLRNEVLSQGLRSLWEFIICHLGSKLWIFRGWIPSTVLDEWPPIYLNISYFYLRCDMDHFYMEPSLIDSFSTEGFHVLFIWIKFCWCICMSYDAYVGVFVR